MNDLLEEVKENLVFGVIGTMIGLVPWVILMIKYPD